MMPQTPTVPSQPIAKATGRNPSQQELYALYTIRVPAI